MADIYAEVEDIDGIFSWFADAFSGRKAPLLPDNSVWADYSVMWTVALNGSGAIYLELPMMSGDLLRIQSNRVGATLNAGNIEPVIQSPLFRKALVCTPDGAGNMTNGDGSARIQETIVGLFNLAIDPADDLRPLEFVSAGAPAFDYPVAGFIEFFGLTLFRTARKTGANWRNIILPITGAYRTTLADPTQWIVIPNRDTWNVYAPLTTGADAEAVAKMTLLTNALEVTDAASYNLWRGRQKRLSVGVPAGIDILPSDGTIQREIDRLCLLLERSALTQRVIYDKDGAVNLADGIVRKK